jgi:hypothetical protein
VAKDDEEMSQLDPLRPDIREAAETLEQALAEACTRRTVLDADTGELIRIEEMLELASDAARRAISLRRKARHDAEVAAGLGTVGEIPADRAPEPTEPGHRLFDDASGVRWDVWAVYPEVRPSSAIALLGTFQSGWLVFESASEKRRLSPIPDAWQSLPARELEELCSRAELAPRRSRPRGGEAAPPP